MDLQLTGKHVLVTGGSRGIGLACARAFLRRRRASEPGRNAPWPISMPLPRNSFGGH